MSDFKKSIQKFNTLYNSTHKIKVYKGKTPNEITREDVEELNTEKEFHNKKVEDKNKYEIGDVVRVMLKNKNTMEK